MENREVNQAPCFYAEIISLSTFKDNLKNFLLLNTLVWACVSGAQADEFTNQDFLALPEAHQKFWIQGAIDVLIQIAAAKNKEQGQCVSDWYFGDKQAQKNGLILATMRQHPSSTPRVVFVFLTERACGGYRK